jgi:hypothetical protein
MLCQRDLEEPGLTDSNYMGRDTCAQACLPQARPLTLAAIGLRP